MLAYAASRRRIAAPRSAPHAMLVIIVGHIALIAAVMSAKMDLPQRIFPQPTVVDTIPLPKPPPEPRQTVDPPKSSRPVIERPTAIVPVPQPRFDPVDSIPVPLPEPGDWAGPAIEPLPNGGSVPKAAPIRVGPRFATPAGLVRPPYPASKLDGGEEATLKLRLSIDERGRVDSVEPVGPADRAFLEAARRHIVARWRYKPATEGGRPIASSTVITLRFELE